MSGSQFSGPDEPVLSSRAHDQRVIHMQRVLDDTLADGVAALLARHRGDLDEERAFADRMYWRLEDMRSYDLALAVTLALQDRIRERTQAILDELARLDDVTAEPRQERWSGTD